MKKIINIKNILKIILLTILIIETFRSCANAFTFDEYCKFLQNTYDLQQTGAKQVTDRILTIKQDLKTYLNNNYTLSNYDGFIISNYASINNNSAVYMYLFKTGYNSWTTSTNSVTWSPSARYDAIIFYMNSTSIGTQTRQSPPTSDCIALIGTPPTTRI